MTVHSLSSQPLATGRSYTVNGNSYSAGLTDVLGNLLHWYCGYNLSFTTHVGPSTTGPQGLEASPPNGLTHVERFPESTVFRPRGALNLGSTSRGSRGEDRRRATLRDSAQCLNNSFPSTRYKQVPTRATGTRTREANDLHFVVRSRGRGSPVAWARIGVSASSRSNITLPTETASVVKMSGCPNSTNAFSISFVGVIPRRCRRSSTSMRGGCTAPPAAWGSQPWRQKISRRMCW